MTNRLSGIGLWFAVILSGIAFALTLDRLYRAERHAAGEEMRVTMPLFVQLTLAWGDRYLASNLNTVRALVAPVAGMNADQYRIQAKVQNDASILNPAHQDNYYIGGAVLPWSGQLDAAQRILRRASDARPFDLWPAYQYGFHEWYLKKNVFEGGRWANIAADRAKDPRTQISLRAMAARWTATHEDPELALAAIRQMAEASNERVFKRYLEPRIVRLEGLVILRRAAAAFVSARGVGPESLNDLRAAGFLKQLPTDPLGIGYVLDEAGAPQFANRIKKTPNRR